MNELTVCRTYEGVGADKVDAGLRAEDVGNDSHGVFVGVDLGVHPFYMSVCDV